MFSHRTQYTIRPDISKPPITKPQTRKKRNEKEKQSRWKQLSMTVVRETKQVSPPPSHITSSTLPAFAYLHTHTNPQPRNHMNHIN